ncbi:MAG: response regulator [Candidatus Spechtbacterales bacterium]
METKVLIITSENNLVQALTQQFGVAGYSVDSAASIEEGLMKMKLNKPGFVVVDISVPNIDGVSFIQQMKQASSLSAIPVIAVLGAGQEGQADAVKQSGANEVITRADVEQGAVLQKIQAQTGESVVPTQGVASTASDKDIIMFVDDDPFLHKIMTEQLQENPNLEVISCMDAETALQKLQGVTPNLILLDLLLPGMSGFDLLVKIKSTPEWKDIPVVILSNFGQEEDIQRSKKLGAAEFLIKAHCVPEDIIAKINEVLKKIQGGSAGPLA